MLLSGLLQLVHFCWPILVSVHLFLYVVAQSLVSEQHSFLDLIAAHFQMSVHELVVVFYFLVFPLDLLVAVHFVELLFLALLVFAHLFVLLHHFVAVVALHIPVTGHFFCAIVSSFASSCVSFSLSSWCGSCWELSWYLAVLLRAVSA